MSKKLSRILAGTLSAMFVGQVLIYGDGTSQGILHYETIVSAAEAIEGKKNADQLAKEFEEAAKDLGKVDYFKLPEAVEENISAHGRRAKAKSESEFVWDYTAKSLITENIAQTNVNSVSELAVTGKVCKGTVNGYVASDDTPIYVRIFNGNWEELAYQKVSDGGEYCVVADGSDVYHVKFECDGYLPFYLKDFGTGAYQIGSGESKDTVTLVPGDTKYNEWENNQWSDDVINGDDLAYVRSCLGAYRGDSDFNPSMDADGDNFISQADLDAFCQLYLDLEEGEYYELPQYVLALDINLDGVINDTDYKLLIESGASETELADFKSELDTARDTGSWVYIYNHEMTGDVIVNGDDYNEGINKINTDAQKRGRSENYFEYILIPQN